MVLVTFAPLHLLHIVLEPESLVRYPIAHLGTRFVIATFVFRYVNIT